LHKNGVPGKRTPSLDLQELAPLISGAPLSWAF
jgi:hypothetical protein